MNKQVGMYVIGAVIIAGVSFFGGMKYQERKAQTDSPFQTFQGRNGQGGGSMRTGGRMGFRPVSGEVVTTDENSFTVKLQDGSSKIILYSSKTSINKASEATRSDVVQGEKVMVMGTENPDGSISAQNIQLNPIMGVRRSTNDVTPPSDK